LNFKQFLKLNNFRLKIFENRPAKPKKMEIQIIGKKQSPKTFRNNNTTKEENKKDSVDGPRPISLRPRAEQTKAHLRAEYRNRRDYGLFSLRSPNCLA
jgi:hypothetical protein